MKSQSIIKAIGSILLILGIVAVIISLKTREPSHILWLCYISLILIGAGIIKGNSYIIASQLNIIAIPAIFWSIDFFYMAITNKPLWNITSYLIGADTTTLSYFISMQHIFTLPLALYSVYMLKLRRKDFWKISVMQAAAIFILSYIFSSREANINCIFSPCFSILNKYIQISYTLSWFAGILIMIGITNYLLIRLFYKKANT